MTAAGAVVTTAAEGEGVGADEVATGPAAAVDDEGDALASSVGVAVGAAAGVLDPPHAAAAVSSRTSGRIRIARR